MLLIMAWGKEFLNSVWEETLKQIFVSSLVAVIGYCFYEYMFRKIMFIVRFNANLNDLEKATGGLMDRKNDIEQQLESATKIERSPATEVEKWLRDVEEFEDKVNSVRAGATDDNERFCGCGTRIRLGSKVGNLLEEVETLLKAGRFPDGFVSVNNSAKPVEYIPGPSMEYQTTASRNLAELTEMIEDNNVQRIGVWGMGGVGKTTLVRNLNNKLNSTSSDQRPFSVVIWITVSKDVDLKRVQEEIADRLNLNREPEESLAGRLHQRLEKEKFLLILDDVWHNIDLDSLGIPQPKIPSGSKILLTSRLEDVCKQMGAKAKVRVHTLNHEEAWQLFSQKAGEETSLEHIEPFAREVARECRGLPLALVTVGTAMREKERVELWKHALKELKGPVPCISGVKDKVYNSLKWSYDSLQGNNIKSCFLYCALYPEDFSIEVSELLQCWLAEGLIDDRQNFEDFVIDGVFVIETLKAACLLEDGSRVGTVKMHDMVRDVAIWIASSTDENDSRSLVCSGIGLTEIQEVDLSEDSVKRVSFMNNRISRLTSSQAKRCSKASTLLLQGNPIGEVPDMFLQRFPVLKVLNVSRTDIWSSHSLLQLGELRVFILQSCPHFCGLSSLGALVSLQVLDLRASDIATFPEEMGNLINLRQVNLSRTHKLHFIQAGIVSKWTRLEFLDMTSSLFYWHTKQKAREGEATLEELLSLEHLSCLSIVLDDYSCSDPEYLLTWIGRIRIFHFTLSWDQRYSFTSGKHDKGKLTVNWYEKNSWDPETMGWLLINATSLVWKGIRDPSVIQDLNFIFRGLLSVRSVGRSSLVALKSLTINNVNRNSLISARGSDVPDLLPNLEELSLDSITHLKSISELVDALGLKLYMLKTLQVFRCPQMKYLFSGENFIPQMPNLELMTVSICGKLEKLFDYNVVLPNLRIMKLNSLKMLRDLCVPGESWPRLEKVYVFQCSLLRSLPLNIGNANSIQEIRGESQYWWSELIWDDEETKSRLQECYNATAQGRSGQYREGFEVDDDYSFLRMCYSSGSYGMKTLI